MLFQTCLLIINKYTDAMNLEPPPLVTSTAFNFESLHSIESCAVAVVYCIYDKKRKTIVQKGTSRACGDNHKKISIHAEQICISYCRTKDTRNKYEIYIWRYSKHGKLKPVYCCGACCQIAKKYNYYDKIFTFENQEICPAVGSPYTTIGNILKNSR